MTLEEVRLLLAKHAARHAGKRKGSQGYKRWAEKHGIPKSRVSEFMAGVRLPNDAILSALGLEWRIGRKRNHSPDRHRRP
jgi:hypothetical protein